jgi:hypothetical protein
VAGLNRPPHDLHVLLRHRLLRQAGGFEGFGTVREPLNANDLPLPDGGETPVVDLDPCADSHFAQGHLVWRSQVPRLTVGPRRPLSDQGEVSQSSAGVRNDLAKPSSRQGSARTNNATGEASL